MADIKEIRRQQLRRLVNEHEGMNNLARKLGLAKGAYISQLLTNPPVREISEKTARKWEKQLRLPEGWLDRTSPSVSANGALNTQLLTQVIIEVHEALQLAKIVLSPAQLADLVTMQYTDAAAVGRVDPERIQRLIGLLKRQ
jgi:hypothetical protein